jgi:hypothetical protein
MVIHSTIDPNQYVLVANCGNDDNWDERNRYPARVGVGFRVSFARLVRRPLRKHRQLKHANGWDQGSSRIERRDPEHGQLGPNRFDGGLTTNYALLPNNGGTAAVNDAAQAHTGPDSRGPSTPGRRMSPSAATERGRDSPSAWGHRSVTNRYQRPSLTATGTT